MRDGMQDMGLEQLLGESARLGASGSKSESGGLLEPFENKSVVEKIIDRLTQAIFSRELLPGQKIPTEAELCEALRVGRNSVREAIKTMVAMGVLSIRRSEGTFISDGFSERMLDPMIYGLVLSGGDPYSVIELRKLFDTGMLQLAIQKRTDEQIAKLRESLATLSRITRENPHEDDILEEDIRFHRIIGEMAQNPLADKISMVIERLTMCSRMQAVRRFLERKEYDGFIRKHEDMVRIIEKRDDAMIARVIDDHYTHWKSVSVRMRAPRSSLYSNGD